MCEIVKLISSLDWYRAKLPVSETKLRECEKKLKLSFSKEYREYLLKYGCVTFYGHELTGICEEECLNVVDVTISARKFTDVPGDWYVIEEANIDGILIWQATDGTVYLTAPGEAPKIIASSLAVYIEKWK